MVSCTPPIASTRASSRRCTGAGTGLFDLAAPDRERIAAALAAYVPAEGTFQVREAMVTALRSGGSLDGMAMSGLLSGQTVITPCA